MDKSIPDGAARLLDFIASFEAPRGYDVIYGNNQDKLTRPITSMTLRAVLTAQDDWGARFGSPAAGRYQFIKKTLDGLKTELSLRDDLLFSPDLQDRLAFHLLKRRGYQQFVGGTLSIQGFALNLAKEWASLPVLADTQGQRRRVVRGQSYYAGDGLNKALVNPVRVEALLQEVFAIARNASAAPLKRDDDWTPNNQPSTSSNSAGAGSSIGYDAMNDVTPKPWYQSKAIIGGILSAVLPLATVLVPGLAGLNVAGTTDTIMKVITVMGPLIGGILAIWGRASAKVPISGTPEAFKLNTMLSMRNELALSPLVTPQLQEMTSQVADSVVSLRSTIETLTSALPALANASGGSPIGATVIPAAFTGSTKAQQVIAACEEEWPSTKDDCSAFVRSVAHDLGVTLNGTANEITDRLSQGNGWIVLDGGAAAKAAADDGKLVIAGLRGNRQQQPAQHGHVVVVVSGKLARGLYPSAYWGRLGGVGERNQTINFAWRMGDRDNVVYAAHEIT